jgi:hypothetical protein
MKKISCKIDDNLTIELRNVIEVRGHDDSIPFNADIYVYLNGKKRAEYVGYAYNDGWGGESVIECENDNVEPFLKKFEIELRGMSVPYVYGGKTTYLPASLDFFIDLMVENCLYDGATEFSYHDNFVKAA